LTKLQQAAQAIGAPAPFPNQGDPALHGALMTPGKAEVELLSLSLEARLLAARQVIESLREPSKMTVDAVAFEGARYNVEECTDGTFMVMDGYRDCVVRKGLIAADEPQDIADDMNGRAAWSGGIDSILKEAGETEL
jgi:hypothetical protein